MGRAHRRTSPSKGRAGASLLMRASNEGLLRPRVVRAKEAPAPVLSLLPLPERLHLRVVIEAVHLRAWAEHTSLSAIKAGRGAFPRARVQRGPSETARCASKGDGPRPASPPFILDTASADS
ncbi:hypothetical protein NSPZN2_10628 [Nitrospira defluvii]|uniref:Uncharacterized protein n=1 Tax=Nitrospira defluvii TaxID=330214 RepID=A0ABM8QJ16_9BACT|nr:hypothetical protein NSPZN2_10628 [Nitrospira defluvii]